MVGTTLITSARAGWIVGTILVISSTVFEVTIFVPSSVSLVSRVTGFLSVCFGTGEDETSSCLPVFVLDTTVIVTSL